jgi:hypothetical protein
LYTKTFVQNIFQFLSLDASLVLLPYKQDVQTFCVDKVVRSSIVAFDYAFIVTGAHACDQPADAFMQLYSPKELAKIVPVKT